MFAVRTPFARWQMHSIESNTNIGGKIAVSIDDKFTLWLFDWIFRALIYSNEFSRIVVHWNHTQLRKYSNNTSISMQTLYRKPASDLQLLRI